MAVAEAVAGFVAALALGPYAVGRINIICSIASRSQGGKIARQTRIVSERIAQLQLLRTKPTIGAALVEIEVALSLPLSNLRITILPGRAAVTS